MKLVSKWLSGSKNYHVGVAIYSQLGSDKHVLELIQGLKTPMAEKVLLQAMQHLLAMPAKIPEANPSNEMPTSTNDVVLKALHDKWLMPYKEMQFLRTQLHQFGNSNTQEAIGFRKDKALTILLLEKQIMAVWAERDYYLENGSLPEIKKPVEKVMPTNPLEVANLIQNCKRDIRHYSTQLKKNPNAKHAKKLENLLALHLRIAGVPYKFKAAK